MKKEAGGSNEANGGEKGLSFMGSQDQERPGPGSQRRVVRILIGTVGGQGGGLLTNWLVRGFYYAGWFAQSIGVLGLAQRSGTVTYYVEAKPGLERPMISVYAHPGDVDLVVGQELLELGRLLRGDLRRRDVQLSEMFTDIMPPWRKCLQEMEPIPSNKSLLLRNN